VSDRWATFDCYGTLADWLGGMRAALEPIAGADTGRLLRAYHELEPEVQSGRPARRYREVLAETLRRATERERIELPPGGEHVLSKQWHRMPVFDDVRPALRALREDDWRLAILSNCDDDLLAQTVEAIGVPFDLLVTAEQTGTYKPSHGHFIRFREEATPTTGGWVHVANSWFHDIGPASEVGVPSVWVNRDRTDHDPSIAAAVLPDMGQLTATLRRIADGGGVDAPTG
jgi:2-haloacid dehalogenase